MFIKSYYKESSNGKMRADIHDDPSGYVVEYYYPNGSIAKTEAFNGVSIYYVEDAIENWIAGIKNLNG